jgi:PAS domain S-box-containing protein
MGLPVVGRLLGGTAIPPHPQRQGRFHGMRGIVEMLLLAGVYCAMARLGLSQATVLGMSPVWPAAGAGLAGLLLLGVSRWPAIPLGIVLSSVLFGEGLSLSVVGAGLANTLEAVLGALLLRRLGFSAALERTQDVGLMAAVALVCSLASALLGCLTFVLSGGVAWADAGQVAWVWWVGNTIGALVVAPALLLASLRPEPRWREGLGLTVLVGAVSLLVFSTEAGSHSIAFLLFPLCVWAALRFGPRGAALISLLVATFSVWGTALGQGPFAVSSLEQGLGMAGDKKTEGLVELQLFLAIVSLTSLLVAAARAERSRATARLELLATAVRSVREGVVISELRPGQPLRMVFANAFFRELVGWRLEELVGRSPGELCGAAPGDERRRLLEEALREGESFQGEVVLLRQDGTRMSSEMQLSPVRDGEGRVTHFVATYRDTTAQKQLQAKMVATERMAAMGMLAAGVGHEINNPLAYLTLCLDEARQALGRGAAGLDEARARLVCAREGAERIRVLTRDLKVFSRDGGEERAMLDLNAVVVPALRMAAHEVRPRARLVEEFGQPPKVMGSEARLSQVMLNLLVNALQAIPEGDPARHEVRVRTGQDEAGRAFVEVSDTGCGMSPSVQGRIFEPFFTTKAAHEGTGLGLPICQQIIQAHGGELRVRSEEGRGSVFTVLLPPAPVQVAAVPRAAEALRAAALPLAPVAPAPARVPAAQAATRRGRILIIDDEPRLGQSMRMLLEPSHDVVVTTRGSEALGWVAQGQRFDLVLCDLQMPEMTGVDVYTHLSERAPELARRLIFISGGAYTQATNDFVRTVSNRVLEKPVRPDHLLATIAEALAAGSPPAG